MSETTLKELNISDEQLSAVACQVKNCRRVLRIGKEAYKLCRCKDTEIVIRAIDICLEDTNNLSKRWLLRAVFNLVIVEKLPHIVSLRDLEISLPTKLVALSLYLSGAGGFVTGASTSYTFVSPIDDCRASFREDVEGLLRTVQDHVVGGEEFTKNLYYIYDCIYVYAKLEEE